MSEIYVTAADVCERVGISRQTLWRWVRRGTFPAPVTLGPARIAFRESDLEAWDAEREAPEYAGIDR